MPGYDMGDIMGTFLVDYQSHDEPVEKVPEITNQEVKKIRAGSKGVGNLQVVEFILGNELFAIDLFETREVINYTEITPLPNTPSFINRNYRSAWNHHNHHRS